MKLTPAEKDDITNIEITLFLEALLQRFGYDFRNYSLAHIKRRLIHRMNLNGMRSISEMQHHLLHNPEFIHQILSDLSINVTEMFRDPGFYRAVRNEVIPVLKTYPFIKIWHAGCSSGEEVYSMAILLTEEGLYNRSQIYATDFNQKILKTAKDGIYPVNLIKDYTHNYQKSGGKEAFSNYYHADYNSVIMEDFLRKNIVFADHNLVTDSVFAEMNLVLCRNVLIYFNRELQSKVLHLFTESLAPGGILCLGSRETIQYSGSSGLYNVLNDQERIYQKKYERS